MVIKYRILMAIKKRRIDDKLKASNIFRITLLIQFNFHYYEFYHYIHTYQLEYLFHSFIMNNTVKICRVFVASSKIVFFNKGHTQILIRMPPNEFALITNKLIENSTTFAWYRNVGVHHI